MKIHHRFDDRRLLVQVTGEINAVRCDCLQQFWNCHVPDDLHELHIDLSESDIDATGIVTLIELMRRTGATAGRIVLQSPPQMLAHTLYKFGMLGNGAVQIQHPRVDVPYAG